MAISFRDGRVWRGEREMIGVAAELTPSASERSLRAAVRRLADEGYLGLYLRDLDPPEAQKAAEAAGHAGLCVVVDKLPDAAPAHVICGAAGPLIRRADTPWDTYVALLGGARLVFGPEEAVAGGLGWLALAEQPLAWQAPDERAGWLVSVGEGELGALTDGRGTLSLSAAECAGCCGHWVEPRTGQVLGVITPEPDQGLEVMGPGEPTAFYLGPNRFQPDEVISRP